MTELPPYWAPRAPWVHVLHSVPAQPPAEASMTVFGGRDLRRLDDLFDSFAQKMPFPAYFGRNWPAFDEVLRDLHWMPSSRYLVVITEPTSLLVDESSELTTFFKIMRAVGRHWSDAPGRGEVAFNTVLVAEQGQDGAVESLARL